MDSNQLAARIGVKQYRIRQLVNIRRFDKVPEPAGKASNTHYWMCKDVEAWEQELGLNG